MDSLQFSPEAFGGTMRGPLSPNCCRSAAPLTLQWKAIWLREVTLPNGNRRDVSEESQMRLWHNSFEVSRYGVQHFL